MIIICEEQLSCVVIQSNKHSNVNSTVNITINLNRSLITSPIFLQ